MQRKAQFPEYVIFGWILFTLVALLIAVSTAGCAKDPPFKVDMQPGGGTGIVQASSYATSVSEILSVFARTCNGDVSKELLPLAMKYMVYLQNALVDSQRWYDESNRAALLEHDKRTRAEQAYEQLAKIKHDQYVGDATWRLWKWILGIGLVIAIPIAIALFSSMTLPEIGVWLVGLLWRRKRR